MRATFLMLVACQGSGSAPDKPDDPADTDKGPTVYDTDSPPPTDTAEPIALGESVSETFPYTAPPADVLFVIDASTSMIGNTEALLGALEGLVTTWIAKNIDFQVGVIDIDESNDQGELIAIGGLLWAEPTQATPGLLLREMVDAVPDPSTTEAGRASTYKALQMTDKGEHNEGFLRAGSELAIILHGDETDQSSDVPVTMQEFVDYLLVLRPDPALLSFNAIVGTEDYYDITNAVSGVAWSVSNTPYGPALDAITALIEGHNAFVLAGDPVEHTITAQVTEPDGTVVELENNDLDYDEDLKEVDLGAYFPQSGATVVITYNPPK